jgi:hypothetical protein
MNCSVVNNSSNPPIGKERNPKKKHETFQRKQKARKREQEYLAQLQRERDAMSPVEMTDEILEH